MNVGDGVGGLPDHGSMRRLSNSAVHIDRKHMASTMVRPFDFGQELLGPNP